MSEKICDHKSVGMLVWKGNKLLLIERKIFPFGFAPPPGHVEGDSYEAAAKRELKEEVGLDAFELKLLLKERADNNRCLRVGGTWHAWQVYEAKAKGEVRRSFGETKQVGWCSLAEIKKLANRTKAYLDGRIDDREWKISPGIETVWYDWFKKLGMI